MLLPTSAGDQWPLNQSPSRKVPKSMEPELSVYKWRCGAGVHPTSRKKEQPAHGMANRFHQVRWSAHFSLKNVLSWVSLNCFLCTCFVHPLIWSWWFNYPGCSYILSDRFLCHHAQCYLGFAFALCCRLGVLPAELPWYIAQ